MMGMKPILGSYCKFLRNQTLILKRAKKCEKHAEARKIEHIKKNNLKNLTTQSPCYTLANEKLNP